MREFKLDIHECSQIDKWRVEHDCSITNQGAIGGRITYQFTPTSLGVITKAVCACGAEIDVTDYDNW